MWRRLSKRRRNEARPHAARLTHERSQPLSQVWPLSCSITDAKETTMVTILLVILILMLLGAFPAWPYSRSWGYGPSGGLGLVVIVLLVLLLTGRV
jgi:hypothetical protein